MVRQLEKIMPATHWPDLSYAERLAIWTLRRVIRRDPSHCLGASARPTRGLERDLRSVDGAFDLALKDMAEHGARDMQIGCRGSLSLSPDEKLLLQCLASEQGGEDNVDVCLRRIVPERQARRSLASALAALAAVLAACGYWIRPLSTLPFATDVLPTLRVCGHEAP